MDKNYKPVYVQGTKTGKGVIEALEACGGINNCNYEGNCEHYIYYIYPNDNFIGKAQDTSQFGLYVKATAEEVKPIKWRAERDGTYYFVDGCMNVMKKLIITPFLITFGMIVETISGLKQSLEKWLRG